MLKKLHGKAKDEQWNNQIKEKLSPSLQEEIPFQDAAWPAAFCSRDLNITVRHTAHGILYIGNAPARFSPDLCMRPQTVTEVLF